MKKKIIIMMLAVLAAISLTGCAEEKVSMKISRNGTYVANVASYIDKEAYLNYQKRMYALSGLQNTGNTSDGLDTLQGYKVQTIDGKEYYVAEEKTERGKLASFSSSGISNTEYKDFFADETGIRMNLNSVSDSSSDSYKQYKNNLKSDEEKALLKDILDNSFYTISVEFDYDIEKTDASATIDPANPKKVSWKVSLTELSSKSNKTIYAYCHSSITASGVENGRTYRKPVTLKYSGVTSVTCNGKSIKAAGSSKFSKHGKYVVVLKAADGEQKTVYFLIDTKKPVLKGAKNNKTYSRSRTVHISDKDSGVVSIRVNGKSLSKNRSMVTITKKGVNRIVVKDGVGNVAKMTIRIRK